MPEIRSHVPVLRLLGTEPGHPTLMVRRRAARSIIMRILNLGLATDCAAFLGWSPRVLQVVGGRDALDGDDVALDALPSSPIMIVLLGSNRVIRLLIVGKADEAINYFHGWRCGR